MTDHNIEIPQSQCCRHYPNRVLRKKDLAVELGGVCEKTVTNLMADERFPKPCWLNSIPVWMLYDIHAFISAAAGTPPVGGPAVRQDASPAKRKKPAHKAGKYRA